MILDEAAHRIEPQRIEVNKRWQCKTCHSWIAYSEATGKWRHQ